MRSRDSGGKNLLINELHGKRNRTDGEMVFALLDVILHFRGSLKWFV